MNLKKMVLASAVMLGASFSLLASSIPYPTPGKIAPTPTFVAAKSGDVVAYFFSSHAGYYDELGLFVNGVQMGSYGLNNHTSTFGQQLDFGYVTAGTALVFQLDVKTTNTIWSSNPVSNSDGINHTYATAFGGMTQRGVTIPKGTFIGFEDLPAKTSDFNYQDEQFVLTNTAYSMLAPEPAPGLLLAGGLLGVMVGLYRRRRA